MNQLFNDITEPSSVIIRLIVTYGKSEVHTKEVEIELPF
jgi:hypothetical protein